MFKKVQMVLADVMGLSPDTITSESLIGEDIGADSLDLMEMSILLEEDLQINIAEEDFSSIETVGDLVKFLELKIRGG